MRVEDPPELQRLKQLAGHPKTEEEMGPEEFEPAEFEAEQPHPSFPKTPGGQEFIAPLTYIIEPHIPKEYESWWNHFKIMVSNILPNANIRRQDIPRYLSYFDALWLWLKYRGVPIPGEARTSFRLTMELQLTRAVDAFERRMQVTQRQEITQPAPQREEKKRRWGLF